MPGQSEKTHLLDRAGYVYNFERMMYINRQAKKAFSYEYIDDNPVSEIESKIQGPEQANVGDWNIYTSLHMPEGIKKELIRVLQ